MQRLLKPWILVLIGACMSVASALVTHHFIVQNNERMQLLQEKAQQIEQTIASHWQNVSRFERDGNIALLLILQDSQANAESVEQYIEHLVRISVSQMKQKDAEKILQEKTKHEQFTLLLSLVENKRKHVLDIIDELYLEKVTLEKEASQISANNASYSVLALFLQVFGLIFVLAKDMGRKEWPK